MYLNNVKLLNFRNLKNCSIHFRNGVNTIIGENDSGKSNAIIALRMLLDESYYLTTKNLKENDFSQTLENWKGHWIIISGEFSEISREEKFSEAISSVCPDIESQIIVEGQIGTENNGYVTLFIRPDKKTRLNLSQAEHLESFNNIRNAITLLNYEIFYTGRSSVDFSDPIIYNAIVGDLDAGIYVNPDNDDYSILGYPIDIRSFQTHISIVTIDALRDVESELRKGRNPIRRIIDSIQSQITEDNKNTLTNQINDLNSFLSNIEQIRNIGNSLNNGLIKMIGSVYSPSLTLQSQMYGDINQLSKFMTLKASDFEDINILGLGYLNMIYISLKIVEFEALRSRELLNIMLIEEPEAHIHNHIQRTLFDNMLLNDYYTQIILTTHSVHISEVSEISRLNVMKVIGRESIAMQPSQDLDIFGIEKLGMRDISLTKSIERYLDSKRSVLMFSKSVILVEGDGEEILIPNLFKKVLGISLDEIGVGLINIGSVAFEYVASLFAENRIRKKCAIITDSDKQSVSTDCSFYKREAEQVANARKVKLENLYGDNIWVNMFYSEYTLEIDFANYDVNRNYIKVLIEKTYVNNSSISKHKENLGLSLEERSKTILTLAKRFGKGWFATLLSDELDINTRIPEYIMNAVLNVASEVFTEKLILKIIKYTINNQKVFTHNKEFILQLIAEIEAIYNDEKYRQVLTEFLNQYGDYSAAKFINLYHNSL